MPSQVSAVLQAFFVTARSQGGYPTYDMSFPVSHSFFDICLRLLLSSFSFSCSSCLASLLRLTQAHARLHFRSEAAIIDALVAIMLLEESRVMSPCALNSILEFQPLPFLNVTHYFDDDMNAFFQFVARRCDIQL